jgi:hypothetical protein
MQTFKPITDDQLAEGLNQCDKCGAIEPSIDLFWAIEWDEHTPRQERALEHMHEARFDAICQHCFFELAK